MPTAPGSATPSTNLSRSRTPSRSSISTATAVPELITGKRYRGHSGNDPGSYDPIVVYAYKLPTKDQFAPGQPDPIFTRIALSVNGTASAGTQFVSGDFDHDGDIDLASAGKLGVHVFENLQINNVPKSVREQTQPLNRQWPFPGEGSEVPQEDGPTPKD